MTRLVLFDLDKTLLNYGPLGRVLYAEAFEAAFGVAFREFDVDSGTPELAITRIALERNTIPVTEENIAALSAAVIAGHEAARTDGRFAGQMQVLPGARALLAAVWDRGAAAVPVTANLREVARIKLTDSGLAPGLDLDRGAYGDEAEVRADLVRRALERNDCPPGEAVVVGDTPADVAAARAAGCRVVAVTTGLYAASRLAEADVVVDGLGDLDALLPALGLA